MVIVQRSKQQRLWLYEKIKSSLIVFISYISVKVFQQREFTILLLFVLFEAKYKNFKPIKTLFKKNMRDYIGISSWFKRIYHIPTAITYRNRKKNLYENLNMFCFRTLQVWCASVIVAIDFYKMFFFYSKQKQNQRGVFIYFLCPHANPRKAHMSKVNENLCHF